MSEDQTYCNCHFKHQSQIKDHKEDMEKQWVHIGKKLDIRWYVLLVMVLVVVIGGNFGIQLTVMDGINEIKTDVALVKQDIEHLKENRH